MATYSSSKYTNKKGVPGSSTGGAAISLYFEVACTAAPATTDTINFGYVPAGFRLATAILEATDMDTGGPTLTLNVGDAGSATRLFSASTVAQAGTLSQALAVTGNVGIGGAAAASAALTVTSTTQGLLFPRMTEVQRDAISAPAAGLVIYNTTTNKLNLRVDAAWEVITSA